MSLDGLMDSIYLFLHFLMRGAFMNTKNSVLVKWQMEPGSGGLPRIVYDQEGIFAEIYLNGAHLTRFENKARGLSMFWMDPAPMVAGRAIKGGVPLVFPWFGPLKDKPDFPRHGFARNITWSVAEEYSRGNESGIALEAKDSDLTRVVWPHSFRARLEIGVSETGVTMRFMIENTDKTQFTFENALHAYFAVGRVADISVRGLDATEYIDKMDGFAQKRLSGDVRFPGPTDSVFLDTATPCLIREPGRATIRIVKSGSRETVVWNPGAKKSDPGDVAPPFVCVEPANCMAHPVTLMPGEKHSMEASFSWEAGQ